MAYTYLIGWNQHNKWYYGVRFAKNCLPSDLWSTYFTSSKHVATMRKEYGEPDVIQIRKIFDCTERARKWETRVIKKMNAVFDTKWLNRTDNCDKFFRDSPHSQKQKDAIQKAWNGRTHKISSKLAMSNKRKCRPTRHKEARKAGIVSQRNRKESGYYKTEEWKESLRRGWETRRKNAKDRVTWP